MPSPRLLTLVALLLSLSTHVTASDTLASIPRTLEVGEKLPCETEQLALQSYSGKSLRYQKPMRVHPSFVPALESFEGIVRALTLRHYGRVPRQIVHLGSYACRRMRRYPTWVSEHALGNAIDVAGFDFAPASASERRALPAGVPRAAFEVRLEKHWQGKTGVGALHAAFLRDLAETLIARSDVFSVVLGPAWPGHKNHFHLDCAPYRVVEVF